MTVVDSVTWQADLDLALACCAAADAVSLTRFHAADLKVETKPDSTPVTDADRAVETLIRARLGEARPGDAVLGEEYGSAGSGNRRWILDPIDGTKSYARRVPVWATLLALEVDGAVVVGVVSAPALGRRWWASKDGGAWLTEPGVEGPRRLQVSAVRELADASLSYSSIRGWEPPTRLLGLCGAVKRTRAYGDFWSHALVAEGAIDIAMEPEVTVWDMAAVAILVTEAGGTFTGVDGTPGPAAGSGLSTNGHLHQAALELLR